jgi:hypothetical protein
MPNVVEFRLIMKEETKFGKKYTAKILQPRQHLKRSILYFSGFFLAN